MPIIETGSGKLKFEDRDGIDYAAVTVQLTRGKRASFLFVVEESATKRLY